MSKIRQQVEISENAPALDAESDLRPYVVFTQLAAGGPHVYAGWLDAADDAMAIAFAREHYGQDQKCVNIWVVPRAFVAGLRVNAETAAEEVPSRTYQVFTQTQAGEPHRSGPTVEATCAKHALELARADMDGAAHLHSVWAIPCAEIRATDPGDLIWRYSDQSYRLASGYSKTVRDKWERIRAIRAIDEYEKEDLREAF
jgi:1,2-phenylacetyl-CoA epoxidase PaaB subunit